MPTERRIARDRAGADVCERGLIMVTRTKINLISKVALVLVTAFLCALVPLGLQNSGQVQRSQALAEAEEPYTGADTFLDLCSRFADIKASQLVSTVGEIVTITTGRPVSFDGGLSPRATLAGNLGSLLDAADYPAWDTLSEADKQAWGSQGNYESAKFNSLMRGFGLGDSLDDFKGTPGGSFTFGDEAKKRLKQIGRIGALWAGGASAKIGELQALIEDSTAIDGWFVPGESGSSISFDGNEIVGWPTSVPKNLDIGYGSECWVYKSNGAVETDYAKYPSVTSRDVFWLIFGNTSTSAITPCHMYRFDANAFQAKIATSSENTSMSDAQLTSVTGYEPYYYFRTSQFFNRGWNTSMPYNVVSSMPSEGDVKKALAIMIGEGLAPESSSALIPDYPTEPVDPDERVYMPNDGIGTEENSYNYYFEAPDVPRPDNPYNPDGQTGGNQWAEDTTANVIPLAQLPFDKLFPFCLLYDVPLLFEKLLGANSGGLSAQARANYKQIPLPFDLPGDQDDVEFVFDLQPVEDLLLLVRPVVDVLLLAVLLASIIAFYKSIITG